MRSKRHILIEAALILFIREMSKGMERYAKREYERGRAKGIVEGRMAEASRNINMLGNARRRRYGMLRTPTGWKESTLVVVDEKNPNGVIIRRTEPTY